jgi:hypothetical protein
MIQAPIPWICGIPSFENSGPLVVRQVLEPAAMDSVVDDRRTHDRENIFHCVKN